MPSISSPDPHKQIGWEEFQKLGIDYLFLGPFPIFFVRYCLELTSFPYLALVYEAGEFFQLEAYLAC